MDSVLLHFKAYGSNKIKSSVMASPDAFVQMALQLAYFRTYGEPCPTYESASTRQFLHGRTETIRTLSQDSLDFTQAFDNEEVKPDEKKKLLLNAIATHVKYAIDATNGKGVDRHLLGLRMMLKKGEKADVFDDPSYIKSMSFKLSSSNVSPGDYLYGGFGPVLADGYGVNYAIGKEQLKFSISSRRRSNDTCSRSFRKVLEGTLEDLMQLFQ
jgi:carnitine O-acetyltransferase